MVLPLSLTLPGIYTTDPLLSVSSSQCMLTDVCKYCIYFQPVFVPGEIFGGLERRHSHSSETKPSTSHVTKGSQDLGCRDGLVSKELDAQGVKAPEPSLLQVETGGPWEACWPGRDVQ